MAVVEDRITPHQEKAQRLLLELQYSIKEQARLFLTIGKILKDIRDEKLFRYMGDGGYDNWFHFLNNPEIGLRSSTAYLYIRIYEYYILKLKMSEDEVVEIPLNRLMRILPKLKEMTDEKAKETVTSLAPLTSHDFDQEISERGLISDRPLLYIHKDCGKYVFEFHEKDLCNCNGGLAIIDKDIVEQS